MNRFLQVIQAIENQEVSQENPSSPNQPVALLLLDINMPIFSGFEVCKKVKELYEKFNSTDADGRRHHETELLRPMICYLSQHDRNSMELFIEDDEKADFYF